MSIENFDFNFDVDSMKQDLDRVDQKPGQQNRSEKFVAFPKGEGSITVRLLPPNSKKGYKIPYSSTRLHYLNSRSYHCLRELEGGRWKKGNCPACSRYNFLYAEAKKASTEEEANALIIMATMFKPIDRYYYNCIVRKEINPDTGEVKLNVGPKILYCGKQLHSRILRAYLGNSRLDEAPLGNVSHPAVGRDFKINKELVKSRGSAKEFPNYDSSKFLEESVLGDKKQIEMWLNSMWDLEAIRAEELKSADDIRHQVDIAEGRVPDDNLGFDPNEWEGASTKSSTPKQEVKAQPKPVAKTAVESAPFDLTNDEDFAMVEDDWSKDFKNFKSAIED